MTPTVLHARVLGRIESGALDLPLLPEVAQRVMQATASAEIDARALAELIRRDQAMAGHILRVANSPAYGARSPIVSLQQATSRLGMQAIGQIAMVVACQTRAFSIKGHEARVRALFRHSVAVSFLAQEIARVQRRNVEEAFLGGLLHDIGRPLALDLTAKVAKELGIVLTDDSIEAMLDHHHEELGAMLATKWAFLPRLIAAIAHHHDPSRARESATAAALVALADDMAHCLQGTRNKNGAALASHPSLPILNLYPEEVEALLGKKEQLAAWVEAFG